MRRFFRQGHYVKMLLIFSVLLFFSDTAQAAQPLVLEIPSVIYANRGTIRLSEIARITGGNRRTREILANVQVWNDGETLDRRDVMNAIEDSDLSDVRLEIRMPLSSRVERPDYEGNFTESARQRSVSEFVPILREMSGWNGGLEISANAPVPDGTLIDPTSLVPGTSSVTLRFRDEAGRVRPLNVRLTWSQNVVFAAKNIKRGDRITRENVFTRPMNIKRPGQYPSSIGEVMGFTSERNIKQGEPVELSALTSSATLKRGRQVRVIARYNGASASTDGVLLEDGKPGDWVRVRKADDRRVTLRARIIDENTVEVNVE